MSPRLKSNSEGVSRFRRWKRRIGANWRAKMKGKTRERGFAIETSGADLLDQARKIEELSRDLETVRHMSNWELRNFVRRTRWIETYIKSAYLGMGNEELHRNVEDFLSRELARLKVFSDSTASRRKKLLRQQDGHRKKNLFWGRLLDWLEK